MTTRKIKSIIIFALSVVLIFELGYIGFSKKDSIFKSGGTNIPNTLVLSAETIKINNYSVPVYEFADTDDLYISEEILNAYGYSILENDESYILEHTGETYELTNTIFSDLSGYTVKDASKKLQSGDRSYYCYKANKLFVVPVDVFYPISNVIYSDKTKTIYIAIGTEEDTEKNIAESYAEIAAAGGVESAQIIATIDGMLPETGLTGYKRDDTTAVSSSDNSANSDNSTNHGNSGSSPIIVLDAGHGKSSSQMTADDFEAEGYVKNTSGRWGEWRHWKSGTSDVSCEGSGCTGRAPNGGSCWYAAGNGDRSTEPDINLNNALAAKKYLEQMGYNVRMTRTSNEQNPSFTKRISYCYPDNNLSGNADAALYVCIHSNAGGGSGTGYITLDGLYDQRGITNTYVDDSNRAGKTINDSIAANTSLSLSGSGAITFEPELIAFCKSPVPVAYLEIGFFDNSNDLSILQSESDSIGKAIAMGIDAYFN